VDPVDGPLSDVVDFFAARLSASFTRFFSFFLSANIALSASTDKSDENNGGMQDVIK
jgi:hypothetical protein